MKKRVVAIIMLVMIALATAMPASAGGDKNNGDIGSGNICRYENPFGNGEQGDACVHGP